MSAATFITGFIRGTSSREVTRTENKRVWILDEHWSSHSVPVGEYCRMTEQKEIHPLPGGSGGDGEEPGDCG